ncbi:MAG: HmuY family protein [Vicingaceae bacterium]
MMRKIKTTFLFLMVLFLSACLKEEIPVPAPVPGNVETMQIEIGYPYTNQVYYDCGTNSVVKTNTKYDWDLSFECDTNGFHVLLNTAKGVFIANQGAVPFSSVNSASGVTWLWDAPSGNLDSTAFGNWQNTNNVFIVDRQFAATGGHLGYRKIQLLSVNNENYTFKYANLDGSNEVTYTIAKDKNRNFIHFNFDNGGETLALEPNKNDWDLLFTNHYHKFSNLPLPFVLTQVLSNIHNGVEVAEDNTNNFVNMSLLDTSNYVFTTFWDEIGYDWKIRNSQDNSFTIDANKSYMVKSTEAIYYKIRFIDFYNDAGNKGFPKFEIQKL